MKAIEAGFSKKFIDMAAPGEGLFTLEANNAYTKNFSGTSGSAPLIAGTIALLYSLPCKGLDDLANKDRVLTSQIIKDAIKQSVTQTPSLKLNTKWGGYLNANGAMQRLTKYCIGEDVIPSPTGPLSVINATYEGFQISLEYLTPDNQSNYEVMINDISGKKITHQKLEIPKYGAKLANFYVGVLASGIYFVSVISPTGIATRKLLVPRFP
jgi:subtilisin family serine protease